MITLFTSPLDAFEHYGTWLSRQALSDHSRRAYLTQVRQFCVFLSEQAGSSPDALHDPHARNYAVRDYKSYLKTEGKLKPTTVNLALAAIDHFYRFLGMGPADVQREDLPQQAPRALEAEEQKGFLRAVERVTSPRDKAVALLLFYTGLRVGECSALNREDVLLSARKGKLIVRKGKGDSYREVPLNSEAREACEAWEAERRDRFPKSSDPAYFLSYQGLRLSPRAIDLLLRKIGKEAQVSLSAHVLRHTCLTRLVRQGNDIVLVAEIAGHRRLETTRRYSLPSEKDRENAMEKLRVEY